MTLTPASGPTVHYPLRAKDFGAPSDKVTHIGK